MGVLKNDVGRPSNKTIMIRNILKLLCVLIVVGAAFGLGYYLKGDNKLSSNNEKITIEKAEEIIDSIWGWDNEYVKYEFANDDVSKTIAAVLKTKPSTEYKACDVLQEYCKLEYSDIPFTAYKYENVEKTFKSIFETGKISKYVMASENISRVSYDAANNIYYSLGYAPTDIATPIYGVYKVDTKGNNIYIYTATGFYYSEYDENGVESCSLNNKSIDCAATEDIIEPKRYEKTRKEIVKNHSDILERQKVIVKKYGENYKFVKVEDITKRQSVVSNDEIPVEHAERIIKNLYGENYKCLVEKKMDKDFMKYLAVVGTKLKSEIHKCTDMFDKSILKYRTDNSYMVDDVGTCTDGEQDLYKYTDVNNRYKMLFGNDKNIGKESFFSDEIWQGYAYSKKLDAFVWVSPEGGEACATDDYIITKATKKNNNVYIELTGISNKKTITFEFKMADGNYVFVSKK